MIAATPTERTRRFDLTSGFAIALLNPGFPTLPVQEILEALFHRHASKPPGQGFDFIPELFSSEFPVCSINICLMLAMPSARFLAIPAARRLFGKYTLS